MRSSSTDTSSIRDTGRGGGDGARGAIDGGAGGGGGGVIGLGSGRARGGDGGACTYSADGRWVFIIVSVICVREEEEWWWECRFG